LQAPGKTFLAQELLQGKGAGETGGGEKTWDLYAGDGKGDSGAGKNYSQKRKTNGGLVTLPQQWSMNLWIVRVGRKCQGRKKGLRKPVDETGYPVRVRQGEAKGEEDSRTRAVFRQDSTAHGVKDTARKLEEEV